MVESLSWGPSLVTPWTVVHQAPLSIGFPSQEYWSGLPFPSTADLPNPGIEPRSPALQMVSCIAGILYAFTYVKQELTKPIYHQIRSDQSLSRV